MPTANFGFVTGRPSTRTARDPRIARASRAVSQMPSMSRRTSPMGMDPSIGCAPGDGLIVQNAVFRSIRQALGAGSRFRCFLTTSSPPQQLVPPTRVRLVERDEDQVRGVQRPRDLLLVRLLDLDPLDRHRPLRRVDTNDLPLAAAELPARNEHLVPLPQRDRPRELPVVLLPEGGVDVGREPPVALLPVRLRRPQSLLPGLRAHHRWNLTQSCSPSRRSGATAPRLPARRAP